MSWYTHAAWLNPLQVPSCFASSHFKPAEHLRASEPTPPRRHHRSNAVPRCAAVPGGIRLTCALHSEGILTAPPCSCRDAEQEGSAAPALSPPSRAGTHKSRSRAAPASLLSCWARAEREPPPESRLPAPRRGCACPPNPPGSGTLSILHGPRECGGAGRQRKHRGGVEGLWAGGEAPVKTRPMLRKRRDSKQLTPSLKSATGKLKRVISLRPLSRVQEASADENISGAGPGTTSECVRKTALPLKLFPHFECFYNLQNTQHQRSPKSHWSKQWTSLPPLCFVHCLLFLSLNSKICGFESEMVKSDTHCLFLSSALFSF